MHRATFLVVTLAIAACSSADQDPKEVWARPQTIEVGLDSRNATGVTSPVNSHLPQREATLRQTIPALREKIARGDAAASCQLARELDFCAGAEDHARLLSRMEAHRKTPASASVGRTDPAAVLTDLAKIRGEYCVGVSRTSPVDRVALWRHAALKGHVSSMLQYGSGLAFSHDKILATVDELRVYRSEGPRLVERVAQNGGFQANLMLARAFAPQLSAPDNTPLLRQAVTRDAAISLAYYRIAKELRPVTAKSAPTDLALETEMTPLRWSMSEEDLVESEHKYRTLRGQLTASDKAIVDIDALNSADVNQPIPGVELCSEGGILR